MASGNSAFVLETGSGWTRGLRNLLRAEVGQWFGTRMWWKQILVWFASVNLIYLFAAMGAQEADFDSIMLFNIFLGLAGPIGVTIVMQNAVLGEKRAGTAAWVLSKPLSRQAFISSKLVANTLGIGVTMVLAQGIIGYLITGLVVGVWLPIPGFLAGLCAHMANIFFYLTLTLMLGTLLDHPAPVIGIPMALLFAQNMLGPKLVQMVPALANVFPWTLAIPMDGATETGVAGALMTGGSTPLTALWVALGCSVVFVAVSVLVFKRQEL